MIQDQIELNLHDYLIKYRTFYNGLTDKLDNPTPKQVRQRYIFSVFTVHRQFNSSIKAFKKFKNRIPENIKYWELQKAKTGLYHQAYAGLRQWQRLPVILPFKYHLIDRDWFRQKLLDKKVGIKGISLAKVSFFLALIMPKENFICLDTWMCKYYGINQQKLTYKQYIEIESKHSQLANRLGYYPFALQWAIWEYCQKKGSISHDFLWK